MYLIPAGNYMFKVNNRNTGTRCGICPKLTVKTPEQCQFKVVVSRTGILVFVNGLST